jgi:hypothetical protein
MKHYKTNAYGGGLYEFKYPWLRYLLRVSGKLHFAKSINLVTIHGQPFDGGCLCSTLPRGLEEEQILCTLWAVTKTANKSSVKICKIWGLQGGDYEECRRLGYKKSVLTSYETHYFSTTDPRLLMLRKIWGLHGGYYEDCRLLGYKIPVRTSQETYYVSATQPSRLMMCKIWGLHGGDYDAIFLDVTPCGSCNNRRFGWTYRLHHQGDQNPQTRLAVTSNRSTLRRNTMVLWNVGIYESHIPEDGILPSVKMFLLTSISSLKGANR